MEKQQLVANHIGQAIDITKLPEIGDLGLLTSRGDSILTFATSEPHLQRAKSNPRIVAAFCPPRLHANPSDSSLFTIPAEDPKTAFYELHAALADAGWYGSTEATQIHPSAHIAESAAIDPTGVVIEANAIVEAGAIVGTGSVIKQGAHLGPGCLVGGEGAHMFRPLDATRSVPVPHAGQAHIGRNARVGAHAQVQRSLFGAPTIIDDGAVVDAKSLVAHNSTIGKRTLILAGSIVCGSCSIGSQVYVGAGALIRNEITIGDGANIAIGSVVASNVAANEAVAGNLAVPRRSFLASHARQLYATRKPKLNP